MMKMMEEICYGMTYHDNMSNDHSDNDDDYDGNYCTYFGNFTDMNEMSSYRGDDHNNNNNVDDIDY